MVRSVTVFDEDFTEDDMDAALDWQTQDGLKCSCGGFVDETMAPGRDDDFDAEVVTCHRCAARDRMQRAWAQDNGETAGARIRTWETG